jgi:hypothetical protein
MGVKEIFGSWGYLVQWLLIYIASATSYTCCKTCCEKLLVRQIILYHKVHITVLVQTTHTCIQQHHDLVFFQRGVEDVARNGEPLHGHKLGITLVCKY